MPNKIRVIRKQNLFLREDGTLLETLPSISQAKRRSRLMQAAGNWEVSVDRSNDPKPKRHRYGGDAADRYITEALRRQQAERIAQEQERKRGPNTLSIGIRNVKNSNEQRARNRGRA